MQPYFEPPQSQSQFQYPQEEETDQNQNDSILSHHFNNISLQTNDSQTHYQGPQEQDDDEEEEAEFSFATFGSNSSPISADDVFKDGQIRPTYPLFNQNLFLSNDDFNNSDNRLPLRPPVDNVFMEAPPSPSSSSTAKTGDLDGITAGPYCAWSKSPKLSKKSNSTGFSKLWRFKDYMHRSHSDGRDAFVFLNNNNSETAATKEEKVVQSKSKESNGVVGEEKKKVKKVQKNTLSAHEVYLRNKGYGAEEDKRRSYLPYRPELVGFFTNVSGGGLTKNVHPY